MEGVPLPPGGTHAFPSQLLYPSVGGLQSPSPPAGHADRSGQAPRAVISLVTGHMPLPMPRTLSAHGPQLKEHTFTHKVQGKEILPSSTKRNICCVLCNEGKG